jgi:hypothetical protein
VPADLRPAVRSGYSYRERLGKPLCGRNPAVCRAFPDPRNFSSLN